MKNVLFTATMHSHLCQFHIPMIRALKEAGFRVEAAANNNLAQKAGLSFVPADKIYDFPFSRSPFSKSNLYAYREMKKLFAENSYDYVLCNTPMGGVITRLAARKYRKKGLKVFYTAHGFHFFKGAPLKNWLLYYPIEWALSFITDVLICINTEDYERAKRSFHPKKLVYVPGVGYDESRLSALPSREEARKILGISSDEKVLLSIGELNKRKNHKVIFDAFDQMSGEKPLWFIAGNGPLEGYLKSLAAEKKIADRVHFLGYTRQIQVYIAAADLFVFPSLQEGLPFALMEVMHAGLPVVASAIRGTNDLIQNGENGFLVPVHDADGFAAKITELLNDPSLCRQFSEKSREKVIPFEQKQIIPQLLRLYEV